MSDELTPSAPEPDQSKGRTLRPESISAGAEFYRGLKGIPAENLAQDVLARVGKTLTVHGPSFVAADIADPEHTIVRGAVLYTVDDPILIAAGGHKGASFALAGFVADDPTWRVHSEEQIIYDAYRATDPLIAITTDESHDLRENLIRTALRERGEHDIGQARRGTLWATLKRIEQASPHITANSLHPVRMGLRRFALGVASILGEEVWRNELENRVLRDLAFGRNVLVTMVDSSGTFEMLKEHGAVTIAGQASDFDHLLIPDPAAHDIVLTPGQWKRPYLSQIIEAIQVIRDGEATAGQQRPFGIVAG